jgi:hypothetical protein
MQSAAPGPGGPPAIRPGGPSTPEYARLGRARLVHAAACMLVPVPGGTPGTAAVFISSRSAAAAWWETTPLPVIGNCVAGQVHLAAMFGRDASTAIRYVARTRQLMEHPHAARLLASSPPEASGRGTAGGEYVGSR